MIQSRRDFLKNVGKVAVAASVASVIPMSAMAEAPAVHPYTYAKLDPEAVADLAYKRFSELGGCCVGVVAGLVDCLAEVNPQFAQFPVELRIILIKIVGFFQLIHSIHQHFGDVLTAVDAESSFFVHDCFLPSIEVLV